MDMIIENCIVFISTEWHQRATVLDVNVLRRFRRWGLCLPHTQSTWLCVCEALWVYAEARTERVLPPTAHIRSGTYRNESGRIKKRRNVSARRGTKDDQAGQRMWVNFFSVCRSLCKLCNCLSPFQFAIVLVDFCFTYTKAYSVMWSTDH